MGNTFVFKIQKTQVHCFLTTVVDANLSFIYIDVGSYGKESDSNIFKQSSFGKKLYSNALNIPDPKSFPSSQGSPQPYVFVGDEAFALHANLLRPYPQRGLNDKRKYLIIVCPELDVR
jgi:hypothetical protein